MAVVLLKSLISPQEKSTKYTPILPVAHSSRGTSTDSAIDMNDEVINEKLAAAGAVDGNDENKTFLPARVNPRIISDATIGLSDGLTVPFALTAGLSALGDTNVVIYGGLAELVAGGISMGLGGYLGAKSEAEAYQTSLAETKAIVANDHQTAANLVRSTFASYDFSDEVLDSMTSTLLASPNQMVDFLMRFHHQLAEADFAPSKAYISGVTIALGYFLGGFAALLPYLFMTNVENAFIASVLVMAIALFAFGWAKTSLVGETDSWVCLKNGMQMMVLGGIAAGAAMGCVKAIGS